MSELSDQPQNINPRFQKAVRKHWSKDELLEGISNGNHQALSHALSLAESTLEADQSMIVEILKHHKKNDQTKRIAITGSPGAGKSSFIDSWGSYFCEKGNALAVLAVDPSSPESGGSILGDKTRMDNLVLQKTAFIRPSPSGLARGGVANATFHSILLCEMAGFDTIFVETVGVGQAEVLVKDMVDMYILIIQPGSGDELQGIKRGIMELADLYIVNKCDGNKTEIAKQSAKAIKNAKALMSPKEHQYSPDCILYSSVDFINQDKIENEIESFFTHIKNSDYLSRHRASQMNLWMQREIEKAILSSVNEIVEIEKFKTSLLEKLSRKEVLPVEAGELIRNKIRELFK